MTNYIIRRLFFAILTFLGITILVYWMSSLAGSPLDALLADPGMTAEEVARREQELGLDQPVFIQYVVWLKELLTGNMGFSYSTYRPVSDMVFERIGATLILTVTAIALSYVIGIPLGMFSALRSAHGFCFERHSRFFPGYGADLPPGHPVADSSLQRHVLGQRRRRTVGSDPPSDIAGSGHRPS